MSTIAATLDPYRTHIGLSPTIQRPTLVLNRNWQPINVATVARALIRLWNDSAKIVDPIDYQLYDWSDWSRMVPDRDEPFIQSVSKYKLSRDIGEKYEYSNLGMGLLGHILALRANTDYETLVVTRINKTIGLNDTFIRFSKSTQSRMATG